jgi:hypothetical protein
MLNSENETRTVVFTFADIIIARFRTGAEVTLDDARANVAQPPPSAPPRAAPPRRLML